MRSRAVILFGLFLTLTACGTIKEIFSKPPPPLSGRRQNILPPRTRLKADLRIADVQIKLPRPTTNGGWPQAGGYPNHAMHHLTLGKDPRVVWRAKIGSGSSDKRTLFGSIGLDTSTTRRLLAQPIIGGGRIFTMDSRAVISAFDVRTGRKLWSKSALSKKERDGDLGGGIAFAGGRIFVTTGAADVIAFDAATGREFWRKRMSAPMRGAPTVVGGRVFVVPVDNQVTALDAAGGATLWRHASSGSSMGILGGGTPAVDAGVVVAPLSSGDVVALRVENGRPLWSESVAAARRRNRVASIASITAKPVIDRDMVFAVSNAGRLAAIDLRSGRRLWDVDIGGVTTPWVAGNFVFTLTNEGELAAVRREDGKVRWVIRLDKYTDDKDLVGGRPFWTGPVLASDRLIIAGSHGEALAVSPYTGKVLGWISLNKGVFIQPVVANNSIYFLDDTGLVSALR